MSNKPQLLDLDASAEEVLDEFPMLAGATKSELSLTRTVTEENEIPEEDKYLLRAIEVLFLRIEDGSYTPGIDDEDSGVAVLS